VFETARNRSNVDVSVDLELGPAVNVTDEMRDAVADAFDHAGLGVNWKQMPGDRSLVERSRRWAPPTLEVFVRTDSECSTLGLINAIHSPLTAALTRISAELPTLPLGFSAVTPDGKRSYSFRATDTPAAIEEAMAVIETSADLDSATLGWFSDENRWLRLEEKIQVSGSVDRLKEILSGAPPDTRTTDQIDVDGRSPLHLAAMRDDVDEARTLVARGQGVNLW